MKNRLFILMGIPFGHNQFGFLNGSSYNNRKTIKEWKYGKKNS